jgi:hypothetical protein
MENQNKMTKIPTAEEIMQDHLDPHDCLRVSKCYEMTLDAIKEFAKLHVEAALKEASENGMVELSKDWITKQQTIHPNQLVSMIEIKINKDSILNSYSLENIK